MYQVTQEYIDKLYGVGKKRRVVSALLDGVPFNENDIIANSLKFTLQAVGGAEINLGGVFLGQLWLTFTKTFAETITRGTWKGKAINISIGLEVSENVFEYIPIGVFTIDEANHTAKGLEVTAYDNMRKLDKVLDITTTSGSLYNLLTFACDKCGLELGMTREQIDALPNGLEVLSIYPDNDMETYRDLVSWIAVTAGGFATINRTGALEIRGWSSEPVQILGINDRYAGGSWSDFRTYYTGLSITNIADQTTTYINNPPDTGLTMNIGSNPLIQYGLIDTKTRQLHAILDALENFEYTPFKVSAFADPFFDLGDVVQFNNGLAGTSSKCCVMRIDFSFSKGVTLQGFGKNPALFGAQSKTDKNLAGISSHNNTNEIKFQVYTNAEEIEEYNDAGVLRVELATLTFATERQTAVEVNSSVEYTLTFADTLATNMYRQIAELISFEIDAEQESKSTNTYDVVQPRSGDIMVRTTEHYFAKLNVEAGVSRTLRVILYLQVSTRQEGIAKAAEARYTLDIFREGIKIYLKGQGLSIEKPWDGLIVLSDELLKVRIGGLGVSDISDSVLVDLLTNLSEDLSDETEPHEVAGLVHPAIAENVQITFTRPTRNLTTEDALFNFVTEDGAFNIVTE